MVQVGAGVVEEEGVEGMEVEDRGDGQAFLFSKDVFQHGAVFELRVWAVVLNVKNIQKQIMHRNILHHQCNRKMSSYLNFCQALVPIPAH